MYEETNTENYFVTLGSQNSYLIETGFSPCDIQHPVFFDQVNLP